MGYSCTAIASFVLEALQERFRHNGSGNCYSVDDKTVFFHERGREHYDGAITGTIFKMLGDSNARRVGSYRIESEGVITRFPGIPKKFWEEIQDGGNAKYLSTFGPKWKAAGGAGCQQGF